jgi:hypothetical protein
VLSTGAGHTGVKKDDSIHTIVLDFDLLEASGSKSFEVIFNKNKTGEISLTSDAPVVYGENAIAQEETIQQEVKVEGLRFQLLSCRNLGKDISSDSIEDGVCEFKAINTSNTVIELDDGYGDYDNAIDLGGNKHSFRGTYLGGSGSRLGYVDGQYSVSFSEYPSSSVGVKIYPGVTVRGAVFVNNIFPDN